MSPEYPGNSKSSRPPQEEKKIEAVVTNEVKTQKPSLLKRFRNVFIGGDSRTVVQYVLMEVLVPQAKDIVTEVVSQGVEKLVYGEARPGTRRYGARPGGSTNYTRYAGIGNRPLGSTMRDPRDRPPNPAQPRGQTFDDLLFATRVEADTVLEHMYDLLNEYDLVSVADLNSLTNRSSSYVDQKWGWTSLQGSQVRRSRDGYVLDLPRPVSID